MELDVAYQTWQDFAALWLMGENADTFLSSLLSPSLCVIAFSDRANDSLSFVLAAQDSSRRMTLVLCSAT